METALQTQEPQEKKQRKPRVKKDSSEEPSQQSVVVQKVKKEKRKRNIDPTKMTYLKAFKIWKEKQEPAYVGLSPKKGTKEYEEIMEIMRQGK